MFLVDLGERSIDAGHQLVQGRRENHLFRLSVTEQQLLLDLRKELILIEQDQAEERLGNGIDISETTRGMSSVDSPTRDSSYLHSAKIIPLSKFTRICRRRLPCSLTLAMTLAGAVFFLTDRKTYERNVSRKTQHDV